MSEYALAVRRRPARLAGFDGDSAQAILFLRSPSARGPRDETVLERLNALDGEFLPCEIDGRVSLVNLSWIAYVEIDAEGDAPELPGIRRARAELDLISGECLSGELVYVARPGRARVSDLLNAAGERFLHLAASGVDRFVRREAILRVRS
ncbi:MAG: hypothetical protein KDB94_02655 [Acidobacteria bacterium]|nr:hypothetical protein [Acidobacteriota bacterium]MCB9378581.1 hypothetical protein [Holophagales bacterium]